ncbi:hypothetical protein CLAIMM_05701 [Cladophialophora immunda]|nr:hypothetical protein CLAIMM_05701 [Cladophialophora immunda]
MPKVEKSTPPKGRTRGGPYERSEAATETTTTKKPSQEKKPSSLARETPTDLSEGEGQKKPLLFLDLPTEIRLKVYENFTSIPPKTDDKEGKLERSNVIRTRHSLQLTCRQINREFLPLFYATTTIIVRGVSMVPVRGPPEQRNGLRRIPSEFELGFLKPSLLGVPSPSKLTRIRRLIYEILWDLFEPRGQRVDSLFPVLERYAKALESLEEVVLIGLPYPNDTDYADDKNQWEPIWSRVSDRVQGRSWTKLECHFFNRLRPHGYDRTWSSIRRMHFEYSSRMVRSRDWVDEVQLVFRKGVKPLAQPKDGWVELPGRTPSV